MKHNVTCTVTSIPSMLKLGDGHNTIPNYNGCSIVPNTGNGYWDPIAKRDFWVGDFPQWEPLNPWEPYPQPAYPPAVGAHSQDRSEHQYYRYHSKSNNR